MNQRKFLLSILFFLSLFSYAQKDSIIFDSIYVRFENGSSAIFRVSDWYPHTHPKSIYSLTVFDFRVDGEAALGPFVFEPMYRYYEPNNKWTVNARILWTPLDLKLLEGLDRDYNFFRTELEIGTNLIFFETLKFKKLKLQFPGGYNSFTNKQVLYKITTTWPQSSQFCFRGGVSMIQRSIEDDSKIDSLLIDQDYHLIQSDYEGFRQIAFYVGLSRIKKLNIKCSSTRFGSVNTFWLGEIYLDFLYAPYNRIYGHQSDLLLNTGTYNYTAGKFSTVDLVVRSFGARFGGYKQILLRPDSMLGINLGLEMGYLPAPKGYNLQLMFRLAFFKAR